MKKIGSLLLALCALCCCVGCEDEIPQQSTWTTTTKEKAYEIFPKYNEQAIVFLKNAGIEYSITSQKVEDDEHGNTWFKNYFCLDGKYDMSYVLTWIDERPASSQYYLLLSYTAQTEEELLLDIAYFDLMYSINNFSTAGADTFKDANFYKEKFEVAYQEIVENKKRAVMEYYPWSVIQWIQYEVYIKYNSEQGVYEAEIKFADCLSDDNVEN